MASVFLSLGSNLGERLANLLEARQLIGRDAGEIITVSGLYSTAAWGETNQPDFYNQVIKINPFAGPYETLLALLEIEKKMGRVRTNKWGSRLIDLDILLWGDENVQLPDLNIPHPHLQDRRFVLVPLAEIAPNKIHPVLNKTISQLLAECKDTLNVSRIDL